MTLADAGQTAWSVHRGHLALLGAWLVCFAVAYVRSRRGRRGEGGSTTSGIRRDAWLWTAVAASVVSGAVHLAVIGEHFEEAALYGWFFLVLTVAQFAWSAAVAWRPNRAVLVAGAAASTLVVLLWMATRTVAIPFGPAAGETEPFGAKDIVASVAELLVAAGAAGCLHAARRRCAPDAGVAPADVVGSGATVAG